MFRYDLVGKPFDGERRYGTDSDGLWRVSYSTQEVAMLRGCNR